MRDLISTQTAIGRLRLKTPAGVPQVGEIAARRSCEHLFHFVKPIGREVVEILAAFAAYDAGGSRLSRRDLEPLFCGGR
jgi:hypothetical protein